MYSKIIILVCIATIIYVILNKRKIYHPLIAFNLLWLVIILLESLHLYGLYECRPNTYGVFLAGILSFNVGYVIKERLYNPKRVMKWGAYTLFDKTDIAVVPNYVLIYVVGVICVLYYFVMAIDSLQMLINGNSFADIRSVVQKSGTIVNHNMLAKILNSIVVLIITPFSQVIQVVGCIDFWMGKRDKKLIILTIVIAFLGSIGEGGRTSIANVLIYLLIGFFMSGRQVTIKKGERRKRNRKIFILIILIGSSLAYITVSRAGQALVRNIYLYFSMQPYMFQVWADKATSSNLLGYGEASLNGFGFVIFYIIKNIFGTSFPEHWERVYSMIRSTDSIWQVITSISIKANAYVSAFWFLYVDGRTIGVIIGMLLYGTFISVGYNDAIYHANQKNVAIYCFLFQGLLYTFIRFPFSNVYYTVAYIMILFVAYIKPKKKEHTNDV